MLSPLRSAGGHRRYSLDDVERVTWLAQRVASGQRISDAAAALRALGRDDAATAGETLSESLTAGALRADAAQVTHDLEAVFRLFPLIQALELVVFPSLAELSRRWMAGEPTVAAEHLLSEAVTRRLSARLMDGRSQTGSPIAIFCPSGEHHKIGALALAALVVEEGRSVAYFGANTPIGEVARFVGAGHVRHAVAVCTMPEPAIETLHYLGHHADGCDGWSVTGPAIHECAEGSLEGRSVVGPDLELRPPSVERRRFRPSQTQQKEVDVNADETAGQSDRATVLLTGATGYVGGRLLRALEADGVHVRCLTRRPGRLRSRVADRTEVRGADLMVSGDADAAFDGIDTAVYLVHSMGAGGSFPEMDRVAAGNFAASAKAAGVRRIVYLGGLGAGSDLSPHLASRQEVGRILASSGVPTIELRSSIIIGAGSLSFELIRSLTLRLPVMVTPSWVHTLTQPIAIDDVVAALVAAIRLPVTDHTILEIGGPDRVSYGELIREYALQRGLRRIIIPVPVLTPRLSSLWLGLVTPVYARVGRELLDGVKNETVVRDDTGLRRLGISPRGVEIAIREAIAEETAPATRWSDAFPWRPSSPNAGFRSSASWSIAGGSTLMHHRSALSSRSSTSEDRPAGTTATRSGASGGGSIWPIGGIGMRRGRRHLTELVAGDTLDFWRVEAIEPGRTLRLEAEMKVPGRAWLQFRVEADETGSTIRQTAFFEPRGIVGRLYWYLLVPVHQFVFRGMLRGIAAAVAAAEGSSPAPARTPASHPFGCTSTSPIDVATRVKTRRRRRI